MLSKLPATLLASETILPMMGRVRAAFPMRDIGSLTRDAQKPVMTSQSMCTQSSWRCRVVQHAALRFSSGQPLLQHAVLSASEGQRLVLRGERY